MRAGERDVRHSESLKGKVMKSPQLKYSIYIIFILKLIFSYTSYLWLCDSADKICLVRGFNRSDSSITYNYTDLWKNRLIICPVRELNESARRPQPGYPPLLKGKEKTGEAMAASSPKKLCNWIQTFNLSLLFITFYIIFFTNLVWFHVRFLLFWQKLLDV